MDQLDTVSHLQLPRLKVLVLLLLLRVHNTVQHLVRMHFRRAVTLADHTQPHITTHIMLHLFRLRLHRLMTTQEYARQAYLRHQTTAKLRLNSTCITAIYNPSSKKRVRMTHSTVSRQGRATMIVVTVMVHCLNKVRSQITDGKADFRLACGPVSYHPLLCRGCPR